MEGLLGIVNKVMIRLSICPIDDGIAGMPVPSNPPPTNLRKETRIEYSFFSNSNK